MESRFRVFDREIVNVLGCVFIGLAMSQENLDRTKIVKFGMFEKN